MSRAAVECRCMTHDTLFELVGGASRDRTDDLKLAKLPLSQLSYGPFHLENGGPG